MLTIKELRQFNPTLPDALFDQLDAIIDADGLIQLNEFMIFFESAVGRVGWPSVQQLLDRFVLKVNNHLFASLSPVLICARSHKSLPVKLAWSHTEAHGT